MVIGARLRNLRMERKLSQGDVGERTGLLQCYISRIEQGHTVPSLDTLERFAQALEVPLYELFYAGDAAPATPRLSPRRSLEELPADAASQEKERRFLAQMRRLVGRMAQSNRDFLLDFAARLAARQETATRKRA